MDFLSGQWAATMRTKGRREYGCILVSAANVARRRVGPCLLPRAATCRWGAASQRSAGSAAAAAPAPPAALLRRWTGRTRRSWSHPCRHWRPGGGIAPRRPRGAAPASQQAWLCLGRPARVTTQSSGASTPGHLCLPGARPRRPQTAGPTGGGREPRLTLCGGWATAPQAAWPAESEHGHSMPKWYKTAVHNIQSS